MKKRILCMLLALLMAVSLIPGPAFATEQDCNCDLENGGTHVATCPNYICPECGTGPWHEVCPESGEDPVYDFSGDVGKFVQLSNSSIEYGVSVSGDPENDDGVVFYEEEFAEGTVFRITGWSVDSITGLWYRVEFCSGGVVEDSAEYWPADAWILYDYLDESYEYEPALEFVPCPVCGKEVCTDKHILCDICGQYDCGLVHAYCGVCGTLDCPIAHIYCEICKSFDCGIEHEPLPREDFTPPTAPAIPENPQLPDGYDVAIVDGSGNPVSGEDGIILGWSEKSSLSAWSALDEGVSYQWQIFVDFDGGFWMDITGQTGKGLLLSRAMLMSALDSSGRTWLRCVTRNEEDILISDAVCVTLLPEYADENPMAMTLRAFGNSAFVSQGDVAPAAVDTVAISIHYREAGGDEIAGMNPYKAIIPAGTAFNQTVLLPTRPGFAPFRDVNGDGKIQTEDGYYDIAGQKFVDDGSGSQETAESAETVVLNLTAEQTNADTEYDVYYLPIKVNVAIRYFFQNIDDDGYTEETEYYYATYLRTGTVVTDAYLEARLEEKIGEPLVGFTRMVHNDEPVAADGSTVFECYYDRQYYMIHLSLVGGHGTEPVYARFGTSIEVPDPVRFGYTFEGWELVDAKLEPGVDSSTIPTNALPVTIPAGSLYYAAQWKAIPNGVNYTVVYWRENAEPNPDGTYGYSVWGTDNTPKGTAGSRVSGSDNVPEDVHNGEKDYFTYNDTMTDKNVEVKGDGSTIVNVYYTRNTYTIQFKAYGKCCLTAHTHGTGCNSTLICQLEEHSHTDACGAKTLSCGKEEHEAHTNACLNCSHVCDLACFALGGNGWYSLRGIDPPLNPGTSADGYIYSRTEGSGWGQQTYYYLKLGDEWYCAHYGNSPYPTTRISRNCSHVHGVECYKDVIHTHAESCYSYTNCTKTAHTHDADDCYSDCTLIQHTHTSVCETDHVKTSGWNNDHTFNNTVYVITAKYDADISKVWPSYDVLKESSRHYQDGDGNVMLPNYGQFTGWSGFGNTAVSKRVNMTSDLCDSSGMKIATANYGGSYTVHLFYMFESFDQTSGAKAPNTVTGEARRQLNGIWYDSSPVYYQTVNAGSNDFAQKEITGMIDVGKDDPERIQGTEYNNFLYYNRISYPLKFQSLDDTAYETVVKFGKHLKEYAYPGGQLREPDYPSTLEPEAYDFGGWYTTSDFLEGTEADEDYFNLESSTMPNSEMNFFAKWVPVSRTVIFFRYYESMEQWLNAPEGPARDAVAAQLKAEDRMVVTTVQHGQLVDEEVADRVLEDWIYDLGDDDSVQRVGFFYLENGEKKAFSPQDIPVTDDLVLYAEWRGQDEHPWRVEYVLKNDHDTKVAATDWGYSRVGVLHTFFAKTGSQLYPGYTVGYFPVTPSHSMVMKAEENPDEATLNVYQFEYVQVTNVTYRVRYLEKGTNKVLHPEKEVSTTNAVVTESYEEISGDQKYVPDEFYKKLVLSVKEDGNGGYVGNDELNVITFYYEASTTLAPYAVHHMLQTLEVGYEEDFDRLENGIGTIGETVSIAPDMIDGFEPVRGVCGGNTISNGGPYTIPVTENGTELYIYYQRKSFDYKVYYYLEGTSTEILDHKEGSALYGATVTETADKYVNEQRYMLIGENSRSITIGSGQNQIIFYYRPIRYEAQYIAVPNEGGISNPNYDASEGEIPFNGSIPINNENYEFVGWFLDAECTHEVTEDKATIDAVTHRLTPKKLKDDKGDPITEYTFYAKFKLLAADFTITRTNAKPGQVFVYRVTGENGLSIDVTIVGNGSVTIADLPYGKYTVTQLNGWSWRYDDGPQVVEHKEGGVFPTFGNPSVIGKWLSGISNFLKNIFGVSHGGAG